MNFLLIIYYIKKVQVFKLYTKKIELTNHQQCVECVPVSTCVPRSSTIYIKCILIFIFILQRVCVHTYIHTCTCNHYLHCTCMCVCALHGCTCIYLLCTPYLNKLPLRFTVAHATFMFTCKLRFTERLPSWEGRWLYCDFSLQGILYVCMSMSVSKCTYPVICHLCCCHSILPSLPYNHTWAKHHGMAGMHD